jgi:nitrite reductase/ring-hydroxylating ferredoxin subunit/DMSO/TMAO reductase YedYZ heme-binding membrane subunit
VSVSYTWVGWNRQKNLYDATLAVGIVAFVALFLAIGSLTPPAHRVSFPILLLRALAACAFLMLTCILCIGPLCRLDRRFLPLLYNRRHFGVAMFLVALGHAALSLVWYHGFGDTNIFLSLLISNTNFLSFTQFPFELLGLGALTILFVMAATSHDFWLKNLTPRVWKTLHMGVYLAYALLVMHVALGALQSERSPLFTGMTFASVVVVGCLHLAAGRKESRSDTPLPRDTWVDVCDVDDIPNNRARTVCLAGADASKKERVAVFRFDGKVCAVSNVCEHQHGPLGEGKVVGGCITCPWHGYQYLPENGQSPPPFTEKIHTYRVTLRGRRVLVDPTPLPKGTPVEPAVIPSAAPPEAPSHA